MLCGIFGKIASPVVAEQLVIVFAIYVLPGRKEKQIVQWANYEVWELMKCLP